MIKYAKIVNENTGLVEIGLGDDFEFYESIGMYQLDVRQSDIDKNWYLSDKCPIKTSSERAAEIKNDLIEKVNYPLKEKVAYTGVLFTKDGQDLCFETNNNSMAMINFILTQILAGALTSVANWKCRRVEAPHEPVSVDFTVEQFQQLVQFAGVMVTTAFAVEKEINAQIEALTVEQLNNEEFVEGLKVQMVAAYAQVPVRLEGLFPEPEVEEEVPVEDEVVDNTEEPVVE